MANEIEFYNVKKRKKVKISVDKIEKKTYESSYGDYSDTRTTITKVDNA